MLAPASPPPGRARSDATTAERRALSRAQGGPAAGPVEARHSQLVLIILTFAAEASAATVVAALYPTLRDRLGLVGGDLGVIVAANRVSAAVLGPAWVWCTGRWSRQHVLVTACALSAAMAAAMGFAGGLYSLLVPSCLLAAVFGGTAPVMTAILAELFEDRLRGRVVGLLYGSISLVSAAVGAALGQLSGLAEGWRIGFWALGAGNAVSGTLMLAWFSRPGGGRMGHKQGAAGRLSLAAAASVFRVPSFNLMLLSRLLSGHIVVGMFAVLFLTGLRRFSNEQAALVLLPFGAGYFAGTVVSAFVVDSLHARFPRAGRPAFLQGAQFGFALAAYLAIRPAWQDIGTYMVLWFAMGLLQGVNPGVNRPIVMSVIPPALRSWAFVVMLAIVEPAGWAAYGYALSRFGDGAGLQTGLLIVLVWIMALNGLAVTPLYWTYGRDSARARHAAAPFPPGAVPVE